LLLALLAMAQELVAWGAGALTSNGAVKITSGAPDAARTLAGSGLADRFNDSPAGAPNHAAGGGGSRAGG
jgi:hypothetical protein